MVRSIILKEYKFVGGRANAVFVAVVTTLILEMYYSSAPTAPTSAFGAVGVVVGIWRDFRRSRRDQHLV